MNGKDLKAAILQAAIQGKLVPQNDKDEPAAVLLDRIRAERARLVKEKKVKAPKGGESVIWRDADGSVWERRGKGDPVCIDDEIPFEIPESWEWARFEGLLVLETGLAYNKENLAIRGEEMIRVLRGGNIDASDCVILKPDDVAIDKQFVPESLQLEVGQLISPAVTSLENTGKVALIKEELPNTVCGGFVFRMTPYYSDFAHAQYLHCVLSSPEHKGFCRANVKKSGQAFYNLGKTALSKALIPVPPFAEQRRIVEKIEEVMPLVGRLC